MDQLKSKRHYRRELSFRKNFDKYTVTAVLTVVLFTVFLGFTATLFAQGEYENTDFKTLKTDNGFPVSITDDLNNTVKIASKPERILSVSLMTDEVLLAVVDKSRIIGVTKLATDPGISNISSDVADIPNKISLNVETILSLSPDLVFLATWSDANKVKQLHDAGLLVLQFKSHVTIPGIEKMIATIAEAVGEKESGEKLISLMDSRLNTVHEKIASIPDSSKLTVMDYGTWGSSFGRGSSWDTIVKLAGLKNAVADLKSDKWGTVPVSKEKLIALNPDILILPGWVWGDPAGSDKFYKKTISDQALKGLKAIKNNRIYRIPESHKSSTSQYIVYAVEDLAKLAYPEKFK